MNRNFALFHLAMARPNDGPVVRRSIGMSLAVLVLTAIVIAAVAIPFISG